MKKEEQNFKETNQENSVNATQEEMNQTMENESETPENNTGEMSALERKELEYSELHDKYLRLFSEFDNYKKRTAKEKIDLILNASEDLLKEIIPTIDDFERAIETNQKTDDLAQVKEGFVLIYNKFHATLAKKGLVVMEAQGLPFDSDKHEALTQIPAPSADLKGKVVDVIEKGYLFNDKIVRFAKVVVGQ